MQYSDRTLRQRNDNSIDCRHRLKLLESKNNTTKINGHNILDMRKNYANNEQYAWDNLPTVKCFIICNITPDNHFIFVYKI